MTQGEIEKLTVKVSNIFSELEVRIMTDIVRRIKENGFASASVDWQISRLQQLGMAEEDIRGWIQSALQATDAEMAAALGLTIENLRVKKHRMNKWIEKTYGDKYEDI